MYKKSRLKIIILILSVLIILFIATLGIIYITTYHEAATENRAMMELYAQAYDENGSPETDEDNMEVQTEEKPNNRVNAASDSFSDRLQVSSFYSVAFLDNATEVTNDGPPIYTDSELVDLAKQLADRDKEFGMTDEIVYLVVEKDTYTLVVIMDNTLVGETLNSLVRYMLIFGSIAVIILFVISIIFSGWIIKPLEDNDKKQKQFVSDAGHELKTPISTINANLEILEREVGTNSWLSNIRYENDRMERIVKQLLDLARMQTVETEMSELNLSRIFMAGILPFEAQAYEKGITLQYDVKENIMMKGNASQIQMLTAILLDNAISHTKKDGLIKLSLKRTHNKTILLVSNEGREIPIEDRERIFDRFYRADQSRAESKNHYGLGLAIAKNIVIIHHGTISVTCEKGWTIFCVEMQRT